MMLWKAVWYAAKLFIVYVVSCAVCKIAIMSSMILVVVVVNIASLVVGTVASALGLMAEGTWLRSVLSYVEYGSFSDAAFTFSVRIAEKYWRIIAIIGPVAYITAGYARKGR